MTAILDVLFVVLKLLAWAWLLFLGGKSFLYLRRSRLEQESVPALLWRNKGRLLFVAVATVVVAMMTSMETAYRPKVSPTTANPVLDKVLKEVDQRPKSDVAPSKSRETWEEIQKRNREENEKVKKEFEELPDKK